jgi:hypothetical protein
MTGGMLGFLLCAVLIPLVVNEAGDLVPSLARCLLRWGARRLGHEDQAGRYEEEWLADLERVPGKLTKLGHACGIVAWSVPRLRAQFRQRPRGAPLSGLVSGRMMRRIGARLSGSAEIGATLQHVAEVLVPRLADHCLIDLFQGDVLIRRVQRSTGGWTPPPGTWAQVGEQIRYPEGHFCQQAMARLDTILVGSLAEEHPPAPTARSEAVSYAVGITSILTAPLESRGALLGVMSVALSGLTDRSGQRFTSADRDFFSAVARQVAAAIDSAMRLEAQRQNVLVSRVPRPWRDACAFPA